MLTTAQRPELLPDSVNELAAYLRKLAAFCDAQVGILGIVRGELLNGIGGTPDEEASARDGLIGAIQELHGAELRMRAARAELAVTALSTCGAIAARDN